MITFTGNKVTIEETQTSIVIKKPEIIDFMKRMIDNEAVLKEQDSQKEYATGKRAGIKYITTRINNAMRGL